MSVFDHLTNEFRNLLFLLSRKDAERLLSAFHALTSMRSFDAKLAHTASVTAQLLACDRTSIFLADDGKFVPAGAYGTVPEGRTALPEQRIRCDDPLVAQAVQARDCLVLRQPRLVAMLGDSAFAPGDVRTLAIAPITADDQPALGLITAEYYNRSTRFTPLCAALLTGAGRLLGVAAADDRHLAESAALNRRVKELEQLQLIARLCGGVAHDVNNALTVILGNAEYINRSMPPDEDLDAAYRQLTLAVENASSLARNLLALGQHSIPQDRVVNPDAVIAQAESLFNSHLGRNIRLSLALDAPSSGVRIDPQQLEQLVTNLVINAGDAIAGEGSVTIAVDSLAGATEDVDIEPGPCGFVRIRVSDDGVGIAPAEIERVREPFFTRKDRSMHSGIGLATVDAILRRVGGSFDIDSKPGAGTCVTVLLPAQHAPVQPDQETERNGVPEDWSGVKVLVVEDHPAIRRLTAQAFSSRGCRVIGAESGEQALALCATEPDVDLLISDVSMPGMNGPELAERLRRHCPYLRAMFISGYADGRALDAHLKQHRDQFLSKPFTRAQLLSRAFEALRN
jgi:signal transduction histidine kinase/CheY-like chemotaxis protein